MIKKITILAIVAFALLMIAMLIMASGCSTVQPVPDTRPKNNYYQLAKQAEQLTNQQR